MEIPGEIGVNRYRGIPRADGPQDGLTGVIQHVGTHIIA